MSWCLNKRGTDAKGARLISDETFQTCGGVSNRITNNRGHGVALFAVDD